MRGGGSTKESPPIDRGAANLRFFIWSWPVSGSYSDSTEKIVSRLEPDRVLLKNLNVSEASGEHRGDSCRQRVDREDWRKQIDKTRL
jgi:hypothetical protein